MWENLGWDSPVGEEYVARWKTWADDLATMTKVRIPRCLQPKKAKGCQLHHFADASEVACGVASYLRVVYGDGSVSSTLVMAKSKLAPIPQQTIPRLELCAAVMATRLDGQIKRELDIPLEASHFWTDSTIVLQYIRNEERRFLTYVANRVAEIRERTDIASWHHVPTQDNPADDASRGVKAQALGEKRWLHGPSFLLQPEKYWPHLDILPPLAQDDVETKAPHQRPRSAVALAATLEAPQRASDPFEFLMERHSSWEKLLRATAWLLLCKERWLIGTPLPRALDPSHLRAAEVALCKYEQGRWFSRELQAIKVGRPVAKDSPLRTLQSVIEDGLLRMGSRLHNANVHIDARWPIILPSESPLATALVWHHHHKSAHGGRGRVLADLRYTHWVLKARHLVRKLLDSCVRCRAREAKPCEQAMGQLPVERVQGGEPAFSHVGVDCFGPFLVKQGRHV